MADTNNNSITMREELGDVLNIVYTSAIANRMYMKKRSLLQRLSRAVIKSQYGNYQLDFTPVERQRLVTALRSISVTINDTARRIEENTPPVSNSDRVTSLV
jgi:hypothetical protein